MAMSEVRGGHKTGGLLETHIDKVRAEDILFQLQDKRMG